MRHRSGSVLYFVTALAAAISLAVIGVIQITSAAHSQASRLTEQDKVDAAFTAAISSLRDKAMARTLTLPSTNTFTGVDTISVTATATDASSTLANLVKIDMVATKDGNTFHKTEYAGFSTQATVTTYTTATTHGIVAQKGYWPNGAWPYTVNSVNYYDIKGGPQEQTDLYEFMNYYTWSYPTTSVNPMGISGWWFSAEAYLTAPVTGSYTFTTSSDDGFRLWVDGQEIIDGWSAHSATRYVSSSVNLTANKRYEIRVEYFDSGGISAFQLNWLYPGQTEIMIPPSYLTPLCAHPTSGGDIYTFPISPRGTYLVRASGYGSATAPDPPTAIDLTSLGFSPGTKINLSSIGSINSSAGVVTGMYALFSSTAVYTQSDSGYPSRIANEIAEPSGTTAALTSSYGNADNDDFIIPDQSASGVTVTIPSNARYLFVGAADGAPYNNTPYQGSEYVLRIAPSTNTGFGTTHQYTGS